MERLVRGCWPGCRSPARLHAAVNAVLLRRPPGDPPPVRPAGHGGPAGARRGGARSATAWPPCWPSTGSTTCGWSWSTTARPTAPPPSCAVPADQRVRLLTRGPLPAGLAGQAARLRAAAAAADGRRDDACWCSSTPTCGCCPTPSPAPSPCSTTPAWTWSRRGRGSWPAARRAAGPAAAAVAVGARCCRCGWPSGRRGPSLAAANGQFLVVPPRGLRPGRRARGGARRGDRGHRAAARGQGAGGRGVVGRRLALAACRMYDGWAGAARRLRQVAVVGGRRPAGGRRRPPAVLTAVWRAAPAGRAARAPAPGWSATPPGSPAGPWSPRAPAAGPGPTRWPTRCRSRCSTCWWPARCAGHRRGTLAGAAVRCRAGEPGRRRWAGDRPDSPDRVTSTRPRWSPAPSTGCSTRSSSPGRSPGCAAARPRAW